jgi:hypothetical protein
VGPVGQCMAPIVGSGAALQELLLCET